MTSLAALSLRTLLVPLTLAWLAAGCGGSDAPAADAATDSPWMSLYCPLGLGYIGESSRCVPCRGSGLPDPTTTCTSGFDWRLSDCPGDDGGVFYDCRACSPDAGCDGGTRDSGTPDAAIDAPGDGATPLDAPAG